MSTKSTAITARKTVQKAIANIGMTVTRSRSPQTVTDPDTLEKNVVETPDATYKAIDLTSDTMKVRSYDDMGGANIGDAANNTWGFDYLADVKEGDFLTFTYDPTYTYKVNKRDIAQGIADYAILISVQVERYQ